MAESITELYLTAMKTAIEAYDWDEDLVPPEDVHLGPIPPRLAWPQIGVEAFRADAERKAVRLKYLEPAAITAMMPVDLDHSSTTYLRLLRMRDVFKQIVRDNGRSTVAWGIPPTSPSDSGVMTTFITGWESNYFRLEDDGPTLQSISLLLSVEYVEYNG